MKLPRKLSVHSLARQSSSYASPGGTETLSRRYSTLKFNRHRDLRLSPVGFGAFRLNASKSKVLDYALSKGVNLIDTGSHFERGNSERVIGQVLRERFKTSDLQRDQVVIVSKSGYMDAESISSLQNVRKAELGNGLCHSLDPEYLAADLTRSLDRLGLDSLDVYMLNNPERMLAAKNRSFRSEDVLDMVYTAMAHIGKEIKKGRVQSFGICSNSMADPSAKDYIPIDSIIKEAKRQGLNKHFSMIEFPLNIFERDAVRSTEECPNLLQLAQKHDLYCLTQRLFYTIHSGQVRKLSNPVDLEDDRIITQNLSKAFSKLFNLELHLMESGSQSLNPDLVSKFSWAHILSENLQKMTENLVFTDHFLNSQVRPVAKSDLELLQRKVGEEFTEWIKDYEESLESLVLWMLKSAQSQAKRYNDDLAQLVSSRIPPNLETLYAGSISRYALHFCLGSLGTGGSVLSGASQRHQVDDALAIASSTVTFPSESVIALP